MKTKFSSYFPLIVRGVISSLLSLLTVGADTLFSVAERGPGCCLDVPLGEDRIGRPRLRVQLRISVSKTADKGHRYNNKLIAHNVQELDPVSTMLRTKTVLLSHSMTNTYRRGSI